MRRRGVAGEFARPRSYQWALILLTLLAFGRGVWQLGEKSLWWDESLSYHRAQGTAAYLLSGQIVLTDNIAEAVTIDNHPPFYFALLWGALRLFGPSEFSLRFVSLAALVLIVPLLYTTGKRLGDDGLGLSAAALGAISPMYLWYAQEARMYAVLAFLSLLSFYFFHRAFFDPSSPITARTQRPWLVAYVLASTCVMLTHYLGSLLIAFELLVLGIAFLGHRRERRVILLSIGIILVVVLPTLLYGFLTLPRATSQHGFRFVPLLDLARDLLNSFSLGLSVDVAELHVLLIDLLFLAFFVLGLLRFLRPGMPPDRRRAGVLLAGFLGLPALAVYLLSYLQPAYMNSRHLILITPAFYLLVASGLTACRRQWLFAGVLGWLVISAGVTYSTHNYFTSPRYNKDQHREWGDYLSAHVRPGDVVVVDPPHISELYLYYTDTDVPWVGLPLLSGTREETETKLAELLTEYDRVWLALSHTPPWGDKGRFPERWLNENAFRVDYQVFGSYASYVMVACYIAEWPSVDELPADAHPLLVRYGSGLKLEGYRLVSPAQSGEPLHVQVFWRVEEPIVEQASVRVRLVDGQGHVWGQVDRCPFNGLYPMWQWQAGLLLRDEHQVPTLSGMPPGAYELELELVNRPDGCAGGSGSVIEPILVPVEILASNGVRLGPVEMGAATVPPAMRDLDIQQRHLAAFDGLRLIGSGVSPTSLAPGNRLEVTLFWEAQAPLPYDAKIRLRLLDETGIPQREVVVRPVGRNYPTHLWQAGERLQGKFWLSLALDAPAGRYTIELAPEPPLQRSGLWSAARWLLGSEPGIDLGSVQLTPPRAEGSVDASRSVPTPANLSITHQLAASLGGQVRLLGYELGSSTVRAGEALSFTLYWQALTEMDVSYTVFTHLLDDVGRVWGREDGLPLDGSHPTTEWQPGEVIIDPYSFIVSPDAPPASYLVEVGLYDEETGTRLQAYDGQGNALATDSVLITAVDVQPSPAGVPGPGVQEPAVDYDHLLYLPLIAR